MEKPGKDTWQRKNVEETQERCGKTDGKHGTNRRNCGKTHGTPIRWAMCLIKNVGKKG